MSSVLKAQITTFVDKIATAFEQIVDVAFRKTMQEKHGTIVVNAVAGMLDTGHGDMLEPSLSDFVQYCANSESKSTVT